MCMWPLLLLSSYQVLHGFTFTGPPFLLGPSCKGQTWQPLTTICSCYLTCTRQKTSLALNRLSHGTLIRFLLSLFNVGVRMYAQVCIHVRSYVRVCIYMCMCFRLRFDVSFSLVREGEREYCLGTSVQNYGALSSKARHDIF